MSAGHECVITWSEEGDKLLRPVKNRKTNSWELGTFQVGYKYQFEIVDFNPVNAIWPHKSEDILVKTDPSPSVSVKLLMIWEVCCVEMPLLLNWINEMKMFVTT